MRPATGNQSTKSSVVGSSYSPPRGGAKRSSGLSARLFASEAIGDSPRQQEIIMAACIHLSGTFASDATGSPKQIPAYRALNRPAGILSDSQTAHLHIW